MSDKTSLRPAATSRQARAEELHNMWKTRDGKQLVLGLVWKFRSPDTPLRAGESVIDLILDREFGPAPAQST